MSNAIEISAAARRAMDRLYRSMESRGVVTTMPFDFGVTAVEDEFADMFTALSTELSELRKVVEVLRAVEWGGSEYETSSNAAWPACPCCGAVKPVNENGIQPSAYFIRKHWFDHSPDCELAAALAARAVSSAALTPPTSPSKPNVEE